MITYSKGCYGVSVSTDYMFQRTLWHWGYYKWLHIPKDVMVWVWALITCSKGHYGIGDIINDYIFQRMLWCECKHWLHIPNEVTACMKIDYRFQRKLGHGCSHVYMFQRNSWHIILIPGFSASYDMWSLKTYCKSNYNGNMIFIICCKASFVGV